MSTGQEVVSQEWTSGSERCVHSINPFLKFGHVSVGAGKGATEVQSHLIKCEADRKDWRYSEYSEYLTFSF